MLFTKTLALASAMAVTMTEAINLDVYNTSADWLDDEVFAQLEQIDDTGVDRTGFFKTDAYQANTAEDKHAFLWSQLVPDETVVVEPQAYYWKEFPQTFTQKSNGSFCRPSDDIARNRLKIAHTQGLVAKVRWEPIADNGFTGIYESGADAAIMRLSETTMLHELSPGLLPSIALKFLISGVESSNLLAMPQFTSTSSWNFFDAPMKSRVDPFTSQCEILTIEKKLREGSPHIFSNSVGVIGDVHQDGTVVEAPNVPFQLNFHSPLKDSFANSPSHFDTPWYETVRAGVDEGDTIFEVHAYSPEDGEVHVANLVMVSELHTSEFGDTRLYFRHTKTPGNDKPYWPDDKRRAWWLLEKESKLDNTDPANLWGDQVPDTYPTDSDEAAKEFYVDQVRQFNCPFAWLLPDILQQ